MDPSAAGLLSQSREWGIGGGGGGLTRPRQGTDDRGFRPVGLAKSTAIPARMLSRSTNQKRVFIG